MPNGDRVWDSGGPPRVISLDLAARSDRVLKPYLSVVSLLQTMTSLSSAVDGVSTVRLDGRLDFSSVTCSCTFVAFGRAVGSVWRSTNDNSELVYSGSRSSSPPVIAL